MLERVRLCDLELFKSVPIRLLCGGYVTASCRCMDASMLVVKFIHLNNLKEQPKLDNFKIENQLLSKNK
jgi:hypothetical protein